MAEMRVFLSYNSKDTQLAEMLRAGIISKEPTADVFLSAISLSAGFWLPKLGAEIAATEPFCF
jgi:hypothetical protein